MPSISARSAKAVCLVVLAAGSMAACSGGDDDGPEATPETDAIALVVAATEENPRALPSGVTYDRLRFASVPEYGAGASEDLVAVLEMEFHGRSSQYLAEVTVLRTESAARAELKRRISLDDVDETKSAPGHFCYWMRGPLILPSDLDGASICYGRSGSVVVAVEAAPAAERDLDQGLALLRSVERHFQILATGATDRVRTLPPEVFAGLLAAVPAPGLDPGSSLTWSEFGSRDEFSDGQRWLIRRPADADESAVAFLNIFDSDQSAQAFHWSYSSAQGDGPGVVTCAIPTSNSAGRYCIERLAETVVVTYSVGAAPSAPAVAEDLRVWARAIGEYVSKLQSGRLPTAARAPSTPGVTQTRAPRTPTVTVTPTATPLPFIPRVNAGTWTFHVIVKKNTCPGGSPAVGSTIRLQFEFTDSNGDQYISDGEAFGIDQTLPQRQRLGTITATLPTAEFAAQVTNGNLLGYAGVYLGFVAANEALISYREYYDDCLIEAE
ncbi:hypothetical protein [Candidatus Amarobacter glycogenicus]|uniref:hypothetical protein n=1 Tax=Candidatus Amarobacter glycogenicus TaxID=3140699 RepID=UPI002A155E0A|nr:hypothetical protein [Dehalococcoidia bacterium]